MVFVELLNAHAERWIVPHFQIDTNRINARGSLSNMNLIEGWARVGVVSVEMSDVAASEGKQGRSAARVARVQSHIYSLTLASTEGEIAAIRQIQDAMFPDGVRSQAQRNDAEIVFNARKYGRVLITNDARHILAARDQLRALGVTVMSDEEAVAFVRGKISERDQLARFVAERTGAELPSWVGAD